MFGRPKEASSIKPITPQQIVDAKQEQIPDYVIDVFNKLIARNWNGSYSIVSQQEAIKLILSRMIEEHLKNQFELTNQDTFKLKSKIYENDWLDIITDIYCKAGWQAYYDPGYNENYEPTFKFSK